MKTLQRQQLTGAFVGLLVLVPTAWALAAILPDCAGANCTIKDFFQLLTNVYNFLLGLGGVIALLCLIIGGIQMILGFLDGGDQYVKSGKAWVKNAIIGLILLGAGYIIVNTMIKALGGQGVEQFLKP